MIELKLVAVRDETDRIRVLEFADAADNALPGYTAGAHLDFELPGPLTRSYSLIDWQPVQDQPRFYTIAVQREDDGDGGSKAMHTLRPGQIVQATSPVNNFSLLDVDAPILLLAGGIGITPLISMASSLSNQNRSFALHYTARSAEVMGFKKSIAEAFGKQSTLYFDDSEPLDLSQLMTQQVAQTQLYICGPKGMIDAARTAAMAAGIADSNIHIELFTSPESQADDTAFEVEIKDTGEVFEIPVGKSIIDVLEAAGKDLIFDCQRGDCGICQTDIIQGIPDHRDVVLSESDKASGKIMQICVSRAKSPRLVLDL